MLKRLDERPAETMALIEPTNRWTARLVMLVARSTPRCHEMTRLLSASMDRQLPLRVRVRMRLHFIICDYCSRYGEHLKFIRRASRQFDEHMPAAPLSAEARERIKRALAERRQ